MLLFFHNPDKYTTDNLSIFWKGNAKYHPNTAIRPDGYLGRPALTSSDGTAFVRFFPSKPTIHPIANEFRAGGRFLFESYPAASSTIIGVVDPGGQNYNIQLNLNPDGTMSFYRGVEDVKDGVTVLALDTFYRIGFKGKIARTGGYCEVYLNATLLMRFDGNTAATDIIDWGGIEWGLPEDCAVNHIYMGDSYGHQPDLIPALLVKVISPASAGSFQQHEPSGTLTLTEAIDDDDPDGDATSITTEGTQIKTTSEHEVLEQTALIYAVQPTAVVRNAVAEGGPTFRHLYSVGGAPYAGFDDIRFSPSTTDQALRELMYQRSDNGAGFDRPVDGNGGILGLQFGGETGPA